MAKEMPQELLDEMLNMSNEEFEYFEKAWRTNEYAKSEYEKRYHSQIGDYLFYNKQFHEKKQPSTPAENAKLMDEQLLKEARIINLSRAINDNEKQPQKKDPVKAQERTQEERAQQSPQEKDKDVTARLFGSLKYETLLRQKDMSTPDKVKEMDRDREIDLDR